MRTRPQVEPSRACTYTAQKPSAGPAMVPFDVVSILPHDSYGVPVSKSLPDEGSDLQSHTKYAMGVLTANSYALVKFSATALVRGDTFGELTRKTRDGVNTFTQVTQHQQLLERPPQAPSPPAESRRMNSSPHDRHTRRPDRQKAARHIRRSTGPSRPTDHRQ